eukprot:COSAG06_NODE_26945_length_604_cov_1.019802_1_plen_43_part_10
MASVDSLVCGTRMPPPPTGIRGPTQHLSRISAWQGTYSRMIID